jgi:hypothetical protein
MVRVKRIVGTILKKVCAIILNTNSKRMEPDKDLPADRSAVIFTDIQRMERKGSEYFSAWKYLTISWVEKWENIVDVLYLHGN